MFFCEVQIYYDHHESVTFTRTWAILTSSRNGLPQIFANRLHLIVLVDVNRFSCHFIQEIATTDEVEVEKFEVLAVRAWVDSMEKVKDFFVCLCAQLLNVLMQINLFKQDIVLIERLLCTPAECKTIIVKGQLAARLGYEGGLVILLHTLILRRHLRLLKVIIVHAHLNQVAKL